MSRSTSVNARRGDTEVALQQHETDSPILAVPQLEQLHRFKPEAVDWVLQQTEKEADHRRDENRRVNRYIFVEKLVGQVFALLIGLAGIIGGSYVAVSGQPWAGGTIASLALTGLAAVFLTGRSKKQPQQ